MTAPSVAPTRAVFARSAVPFGVLVGALVLAACGGARSVSPDPSAVARWSGGALSLDEFEAAYAATEAAVADSSMTLPERRVDFLERYVDFQLKVLAARAAGYDLSLIHI